MNTGIENVILGAITNGFASIIYHLTTKTGQLIVGKELQEKIKSRETALTPILQKAINVVTEELEILGPTRMETVCLFLSTSDVEAIVRQIYSTQIVEEANKNSLKIIQEEFFRLFVIYTGQTETSIKSSTNKLFNSLVETCQLTLALAIDKNILSAHEAQSSLRFKMLRDELISIDKNIALLSKPKRIQIDEILEFEKKYREQIVVRTAYITPPHFDTARKVPINDLYVTTDFMKVSKNRDTENSDYSVNEFLSNLYRAVLLGNPGGGKSTFAIKLCHDLALKYNDRILGGRRVTPILVILREYGAEKKSHRCSILQHIETISTSRYQITPPKDSMEFLFRNGHLAVIFDGLDELLDTSYRQEITADVESFCTLYPSVPVIVTSREVGYEQAPLDEKRFDTFRLSPFNDKQVNEYVHKWFRLDDDLSSEQQNQKADSFTEESQIVPDLRSNPLMLALMCNIYRGENYIPRNRPDVYEKCALLLFERLDKSKGIYVQFPFEAHIAPAIKYIAHWIYENGKLRSGVSEAKLISKAAEYLCPRRFEDIDEAVMAARDFIEFCRGRAWVFTDTGTTKEGDRLYQFTHGTFLEYFTAAHIVRTHPVPERLLEMLLPKIIKREWDVVAQLTFQMQNKNVEGAGDELLNALLNKAKTVSPTKKYNLLSFATRCLEFMIPSPKVTREICIACLKACMNIGLDVFSKTKKTKQKSQGNVEDLLEGLLISTVENRPIVTEHIEKFYTDNVSSTDENKALVAIEISRDITIPLHSSRLSSNVVFKHWEDISHEFILQSESSLFNLASKHIFPCMILYWERKVDIEQIIRWHGLSSIFVPYRHKLFSNVTTMAFAHVMLSYLGASNIDDKPDHYKQLKLLGKILSKESPPWFKSEIIEGYIGSYNFSFRPWAKLPPENELLGRLDSNGLLAAFSIVATVFELSKNTKDRKNFIKEFKSVMPSLEWIGVILFSRLEWKSDENLIQLLDTLGFSDPHQEILLQWARGDIQLTNVKKNGG